MAEFISRYLKRSPKDISFDDILEFLDEDVEASLTLEYKPRDILVNAKGVVHKATDPARVVGFSELAKLVAGFANAAGGLFILGVKEKAERFRGDVVRVLPGVVSALPPTITSDMIEHQLDARIQAPIEGLTIVPLRKTEKSKNSVYLIDVPQSTRAPHRVNELYYFQRNNFTTLEMYHYQIADLFGRRYAPELDLEITRVDSSITLSTAAGDTRKVMLDLVLHNRGRAPAKYLACVCNIVEGAYRVNPPQPWSVHSAQLECRYERPDLRILYPSLPLELGRLSFLQQIGDASPYDDTMVIEFRLFAEDMRPVRVLTEIDPINRKVLDIQNSDL